MLFTKEVYSAKLDKGIKKGRGVRIGNGKSVPRAIHLCDVCEAICIFLLDPKVYFSKLMLEDLN